MKIGESGHTTTYTTQTRERTYAGASYDVYTSSGAHVGTVSSPDTTVTESRTVKTDAWTNHYRCIHCGHISSSGEEHREKSSWN